LLKWDLQEQSRDLHETFHSQLERAEDGFSLVADYFGRGVFNKLTVITDSPDKTNISKQM
jgi:acetylornithine/succinyldiaminopimelate/putrescine aminotransferase